jgi:hypothetical protein
VWDVVVSEHVFKKFTQGKYHYVFGEVYAPLQIDSDGETMTAEEIQKLAHEFIAQGKISSIDLEHDHVPCGAKVVESFIARKGDPDYHEGAWVLGVRLEDGEIWDAVKSGEINSYSFNAWVAKEPKTVEVVVAKSAMGITQANTVTENERDTDIVPTHTHTYYVEFDNNGKPVFGTTDEVFAHKHMISRSIITAESLGHRHRYLVD